MQRSLVLLWIADDPGLEVGWCISRRHQSHFKAFGFGLIG